MMKEIKCFYDYWHLNYVEDVPYTTLIYTDIYIYVYVSINIYMDTKDRIHDRTTTRFLTVPSLSLSE